MFITKKRHQELINFKNVEIESLKVKIKEYDFFTKILKYIDERQILWANCGLNGSVSFANLVDSLPDSVAKLVDDYFGGKVFKHEATTTVIEIDKEGKVTYHVTKRPCDKGRKYLLVQK